MAQALITARNGRYSGKGDPLKALIVGEHSKGHQFIPANLYAALVGFVGLSSNSSYNAPDFTERTTGAGASIAMGADGLVLTSGSAAATDDAQFQSIRSWTPAAGKRAVAFAKIKISDIANPGFVFGFANTVTDWFGTEATHSAAFLMAKGAATVVGRSKDGTTGSSSATLATMVADTFIELAVVINGTTGVEYWVKTATGSWTATSKTTNLPTAALRLTCEIESGAAANKTLTLAYWGFYGQV